MKDWLRRCMDSLERCNGHAEQLALPHRLVHVTPDSGRACARLQVVDQDAEGLKYITLSHRWGGAKSLMLTTSSFSRFKQGIPWDELPKTFKDALLISLQLGFSYIWIDSLCIVQDSNIDWSQQSALMRQIYQGSSCTIAATGSVDSNSGCFHDRDLQRLADCTLTDTARPRGLRICLCGQLEASFENQVNASPLNARAWVFQEHLLSMRVIHFAEKAIFWECRTCIIMEQRPSEPVQHAPASNTMIATHHAYRDTDIGNQNVKILQAKSTGRSSFLNSVFSRDAMQDFRVAFEALKNASHPHSDLEIHTFTRWWYQLVSRYTIGSLTLETDRLIAISGIAEEVQARTKMTYFVGLWIECLPLQILCYVDLPTTNELQLSLGPSWSWAPASAGGKIRYGGGDNLEPYDYTKSADANIDSSKSSKSTSQGGRSRLWVDGVVQEVVIRRSAENDPQSGINYTLVKWPSGQHYGRFYPDSLDKLQYERAYC